MKKVYKLWILCVVVLCHPLLHANGENDLSHKIQKSFAIHKDMYVEVDNKYGDIEVQTWDKDSIRFDIEIIVRSDKDVDLDEVMDRIDIDFRANTTYVLANTKWADDVNFFHKGLQNLKKGLGSYGNIEVNYIVSIPSDIELEIFNKFGNIYMGDYDGPLTLNLEHGDLRARHLSNVKKISVKYGKLKISEIDRGNLILTAVKTANIISADDIMITSSSSEVEIDEVTTLNMTSKHDVLRIETVDNLFGNISLSDLRVTLIKNESRLHAKFGSIYFREIDTVTNNISIEAEKTDIFLNFNDSFNGTFNIQVDEDKKLTFSQSMTVNTKEMRGDSQWKIKASHGTGHGTMIDIISTKGFVQIGK